MILGNLSRGVIIFHKILKSGESYCDRDYVNCEDACESKSCERGCLVDYIDCFRQCPCEQDCPNGCDGCAHSICTCKNPGLENKHHKQCMTEAMDEQYACLGDCNGDKSCLDACLEKFSEDSDRCPCMSGCELGCPCSGYDCQPYLTAICQGSGTFGFSYAISSSGHSKVR